MIQQGGFEDGIEEWVDDFLITDHKLNRLYEQYNYTAMKIEETVLDGVYRG